MTVALVTGSHGFVGSHLRGVLRGAGWQVVGLGRTPADAGDGESYIEADVTDPNRMGEAVYQASPDVVFHLAASIEERTAAPSGGTPSAVAAAAALCAAVRLAHPSARIILVGSSAEYGSGPLQGGLVTEEMATRPVNWYGRVKLAAEELALSIAADASLDVVPVRPFNHIGPGERTHTVAGALARQVAALARGKGGRVTVRDSSVVRDFTDVRDVARGYLALAEHGVSGRVYNLCSGRGQAVRDVAWGLLDASGLDRSLASLLPDQSQAIRRQVGSPARIVQDTGWTCTIAFASSLNDLMRWALGQAGND